MLALRDDFRTMNWNNIRKKLKEFRIQEDIIAII